MPGESIRVTRSVVLPLAEVEFRTSRSSGPGGQHAQKTETRVEALFDVERSEALTEAQKRRVVATRGPDAARGGAGRAEPVAQPRARARAARRQLREALRVPRRRRPTKPSQASVERRLEESVAARGSSACAPAATTDAAAQFFGTTPVPRSALRAPLRRPRCGRGSRTARPLRPGQRRPPPDSRRGAHTRCRLRAAAR